jgi:hypothetical protein
MMKPVADQFASILVAAGVKRIYGIVGDSHRSIALHETVSQNRRRPSRRLASAEARRSFR